MVNRPTPSPPGPRPVLVGRLDTYQQAADLVRTQTRATNFRHQIRNAPGGKFEVWKTATKVNP